MFRRLEGPGTPFLREGRSSAPCETSIIRETREIEITAVLQLVGRVLLKSNADEEGSFMTDDRWVEERKPDAFEDEVLSCLVSL